MKVSELKGAWLDYWVAVAEGVDRLLLEIRPVPRTDDFMCIRLPYDGKMAIAMNYHTSWALCGALVDKYHIELVQWPSYGISIATAHLDSVPSKAVSASNSKEAICRAVVQRHLGDEVPDIDAVFRN